MNDPRLEAMGDTPGSDVCGCTRSVPPLRRIILREPRLLRETSTALSERGYVPWSFWLDDDMCVQFHAEKNADLSFLDAYGRVA